MRVLLLEDDTVEALTVQRELAGRYDLRVVPTLAEAQAVLAYPGWRPDVIVSDLGLPDADAPGAFESLQRAAAGTPIVVSTGGVTQALRRQLDALGAAKSHDKDPGGGVPDLLKAVLQQQQLFQHALGSQRREVMAELEKVARGVADAAAERAIDRLVDRLGLEDEEGLRMAIRLARGWEAAKLRFLSAVVTGVGSAFLLALGAGVVAMLRENAAK